MNISNTSASSSPGFAIVGVAESDLGKIPDKTAVELQAQAARRALLDAGLTLQEVDGVFAHTDDRFPSLQLTEYLGDHGIKVRYLHSEIETVERVEILRDLRIGVLDRKSVV